MGDGLKCPVMKWGTGDDHSALLDYQSRLNRWFTIKNIAPEKQHDYIIFQAGEKGEELSKTWNLNNNDLKEPKNVWEVMSQSVGASDNFRVNRLELISYKQKDNESADEFYVRCRGLALKCKFTSVDERLIDQLVAGTRVKEARKELLKADEKLKVEDALKICRTHEASETHMKAFNLKTVFTSSSGSKTVDAVRKKRDFQKKKEDSHSKMPVKDCSFCGRDHEYGRCPAYNSTCGYCKKKGHWKDCCLKLKGQSSVKETPQKKETQQKKKKSVHNVEVEEEFERLSFDVVTQSDHDDNDIKVKFDLKMPDDKLAYLTCKIDTGAQGNVLPLRTFRNMFPKHLDDQDLPSVGSFVKAKPFVKLSAYNGSEIKQFGTVNLKLRYGTISSQWTECEFFVCDTPGPVLVGKKTSLQTGVITVNAVHSLDLTPTLKVCEVDSDVYSPIPDKETLVNLYPDRFEGLGKFPGKYHIDVRSDVKPVVKPPRKYPIHLKQEIQESLDDMIKLDVIEPIPEAESTEWLNSLAFSRKENGKLRICLDPRDLNVAVKRTFHRTPTIEEITHKLSNAKVFSKLDAKSGYWSVQLDKESSVLTSFCGPSGRFRFKRLPFGLKVAQDVFQEKMDLILAGCSGTMNIADDILVFGTDVQDHDKNLHDLMKRARSHGLVLNANKCTIRTDSVNFFGMVYTTKGLRPDPRKCQEIKDLPTPKDVKSLQQFLGMIQYLAPFVPKLSEKTCLLRDLVKKDSDFVWLPNHEKAFELLKNEICRNVTLNYFDPNLPTKVQVDASKRGLGAALIQVDSGKEKIIAFASKALTPVEERYANIEREMLAVVFGAERFHTFLYGSSFVIESDHKPLENIQLKNLAQAPPRLQRMLLRLQSYDMTIKYRPGKQLLLADAMSRMNPQSHSEIKLEKTVHAVQWSDAMISGLQRETENDPELRPLKDIILTRWPENSNDLPKCIRHYWSMKDFLTVEDGVILKGDRFVIPEKMQEEILNRLHASHQGIEKTRLRARSSVYWRGIDKDIEKLIQGCSVCLEFSRSEQKESMIGHTVPSGPWQEVGTDLFELDGVCYLITADYYSKMPFIRRITSESSRAVIAKLKTLFSEHGIPEKVYSDGGPCYSSSEFVKFAESWGFRHIMSSPRYPQSNGFIERTIQTVKNIMRKAKTINVDAEMALLCARTTPVDSQIGSPAELLYNRVTRSNLPVRIKGNDLIVERLQERQLKQEEYYNRGSKDLPELYIGQTVGLQDVKSLRWNKAKVVEKQDPRSYVVETKNGSYLRRNRRHLKDLMPENFTTNESSSSDSNVARDVQKEAVQNCSNSDDVNLVQETSGKENNRVTRSSSRLVKAPERLIETI